MLNEKDRKTLIRKIRHLREILKDPDTNPVYYDLYYYYMKQLKKIDKDQGTQRSYIFFSASSANCSGIRSWWNWRS